MHGETWERFLRAQIGIYRTTPSLVKLHKQIKCFRHFKVKHTVLLRTERLVAAT